MSGTDSMLSTAPIDHRFPQQNQARHCWTLFNEFLLCAKENDGNFAAGACAQKKLNFEGMCPKMWVEKWEEQRADGKFPGVQLDAGPIYEDDE